MRFSVLFALASAEHPVIVWHSLQKQNKQNNNKAKANPDIPRIPSCRQYPGFQLEGGFLSMTSEGMESYHLGQVRKVLENTQ